MHSINFERVDDDEKSAQNLQYAVENYDNIKKVHEAIDKEKSDMNIAAKDSKLAKQVKEGEGILSDSYSDNYEDNFDQENN